MINPPVPDGGAIPLVPQTIQPVAPPVGTEADRVSAWQRAPAGPLPLNYVGNPPPLAAPQFIAPTSYQQPISAPNAANGHAPGNPQAAWR